MLDDDAKDGPMIEWYQLIHTAADALATIPRRPDYDANVPATMAFSVLGVLLAAGFIGYGIQAWMRDSNRIPAYSRAGRLLATAFEPRSDRPEQVPAA